MFRTLCIITLWFMYACSGGQDEGKSRPATGEVLTNIPIVRVAVANDTSLDLYIKSAGYAEAQRQVAVILRKSGYIRNQPQNGIRLASGQLVIQLDDEDEQIALAEAHAALVRSITEYAANMDMPDTTQTALLALLKMNNHSVNPDESYIRQVLSGDRRDEVMLVSHGVMDAWNRYRRAQLELAHTRFTAPFNGYLADVKYRQNEWAPAGQPLARFVDLETIRIRCGVLESEATQLSKGARATVKFPAIPGETFSGIVSEINPVIDTDKRVMTVFVNLQNPGKSIAPGMYSDVRIEISSLQNRLVVPREAIVIRDNRELVFIVRDSTAQWCYVQTGARNDEYVEIVSSEFNLQPGEPVVTEGHFSLAHNALVKIQN